MESGNPVRLGTEQEAGFGGACLPTHTVAPALLNAVAGAWRAGQPGTRFGGRL